MSDCGVGAMVQAAAWCETRLGMETLGIGRQPLDRKDSCTLEICGAPLFYTVVIDGGFAFVFAQPMDGPAGSLESLLNVGDTKKGWKTIIRFIEALELNEIKTLGPRPLEIGPPGSGGWVIA